MPPRRLPFSLWPSNRRQWLAVALIALIIAVHLALIDWANDSLALIRALDEEDDTAAGPIALAMDVNEAQPVEGDAA